MNMREDAILILDGKTKGGLSTHLPSCSPLNSDMEYSFWKKVINGKITALGECAKRWVKSVRRLTCPNQEVPGLCQPCGLDRRAMPSVTVSCK